MPLVLTHRSGKRQKMGGVLAAVFLLLVSVAQAAHADLKGEILVEDPASSVRENWLDEMTSDLGRLRENKDNKINMLRVALLRPFHPSAVDELASSFEDWDAFPPCQDKTPRNGHVDLFLHMSQTWDAHPRASQTVKKLLRESGDSRWAACFDSIRTIQAEIPPEVDKYHYSSVQTDPMWVNGPNTQFRLAFRDLQGLKHDAMYVMESDSQPLEDFWLDRLLQEIVDTAPFALLGSKYHGWTEEQRERMSLSLLNHINGNAVYNLTDPLMDKIVGELELEATTSFNAVPYDYRISQILTEASTGTPPENPYPYIRDINGHAITFTAKTEQFQSWLKESSATRPDYSPVCESKVIFNAAMIDVARQDILQDQYGIVHGKLIHDQWNPVLHGDVSLVLSDTRGQSLAKEFLSKLDSCTHPFSEVVLMRHISDYNDEESLNGLLKVPVSVHKRGTDLGGFHADLCAAPVTTEWFLWTDTYHTVASSRITLFFASDEPQPVVPFIPMETCNQSPECQDMLSLSRALYYPTMDKAVLTSEMLIQTKHRDSFCKSVVDSQDHPSWKASLGYTATMFMAYLYNQGLAEEVYELSDTLGSLNNFVVRNLKTQETEVHQRFPHINLAEGGEEEKETLLPAMEMDGVNRRLGKKAGYPGGKGKRREWRERDLQASIEMAGFDSNHPEEPQGAVSALDGALLGVNRRLGKKAKYPGGKKEGGSRALRWLTSDPQIRESSVLDHELQDVVKLDGLRRILGKDSYPGESSGQSDDSSNDSSSDDDSSEDSSSEGSD